MHKFSIGLIVASIFLTCTTLIATPKNNTHYFQGFYIGGTTGGALTHFKNNTHTQSGNFLNSQQATAINEVGQQDISTTGFLTGISAGYNWVYQQFLFGLSADFQAMSNHGETNTPAILYPNNPNQQFVLTSYGKNNWLFTLHPRIGFVTHNWLFYITGGLGLALVKGDFIFSNNFPALESQRVSKIIPGYVLGTGAEVALTKHISLDAEYLFANYKKTTASQMNQFLPASQNINNTLKMKSNIFKIGLNYKFNDQLDDPSLFVPFMKNLLNRHFWHFTLGTRAFLSSGIDGSPQPLLNNGNTGNVLASRLTFDHLTAISEELFAHLENNKGYFLKSFLGTGTINHGQLNDEDFPAGGAYSNTLSKISGSLSYFNIDAGYNFFNSDNAQTGILIGYNFYRQNLSAYDCQQLAGSTVCVPTSLLYKFLGISETDKYRSLRLGLTSTIHISPKISLMSEAVYLPIVNMRGLDLHNARQLLGPESANRGNGAMIQTILDYQFSSNWQLGLGGRYWIWNMKNSQVIFDFLGQNGLIVVPARFNTNRYGVFLQLSYHPTKLNDDAFSSTNIKWQGVFVGGMLGGAWGTNQISDPFGATVAQTGFINAANFGNKIRSTGSLAAINLLGNIQWSRWVVGLGSTFDPSDIRGENTLFSGIGGINGLAKTNRLFTLFARVGYTFHRALFYIKLGRGLEFTHYILNGNTSVLTLGTENQKTHAWGWLTGFGVDYAITNHWTTAVEFSHLLTTDSVNFPTINIVNRNTYSIKQLLNTFTLNIAYKIF